MVNDDGAPTVFDQRSAVRVGRVVRIVESSAQPGVGVGANYPTRDQFFWATLSNEVVSSGAYSYDFVEIQYPGGANSVAGRSGSSGGAFPKISTPSAQKMDITKPALVRVDFKPDGTITLTIVAEDPPLTLGTYKYQVLQMAGDNFGTNHAGTTWDWPLAHS